MALAASQLSDIFYLFSYNPKWITTHFFQPRRLHFRIDTWFLVPSTPIRHGICFVSLDLWLNNPWFRVACCRYWWRAPLRKQSATKCEPIVVYYFIGVEVCYYILPLATASVNGRESRESDCPCPRPVVMCHNSTVLWIVMTPLIQHPCLL